MGAISQPDTTPLEVSDAPRQAPAIVAHSHKPLSTSFFVCHCLLLHFYLPFHLCPQQTEQSSMAQFNIPQILLG